MIPRTHSNEDLTSPFLGTTLQIRRFFREELENLNQILESDETLFECGRIVRARSVYELVEKFLND